MILVLDASVVVKWFVPEEKQPEAEELFLSTATLAAPRLIATEVGTALSKKVRLENLPAPEARASLAIWLEQLIPQGRPVLYDDEPLLAAALDLSLKLNHQLSDCLYLALAHKLNARLVTADTKFVEKAALLRDSRVIPLGADLSAGSGGRR